MERSASAPVLTHEDYYVPSNGVGDTGMAHRTVHGPFAKDKGTHSSRINQIIRQAEKVPGPGKYASHEDWAKNGGNAFCKVERQYKPCNKTPAPTLYERKDIMDARPIGAKDVLSDKPRITQGVIPKGKKRSFLDQAIAHSDTIPGFYTIKNVRPDRVDCTLKGVTQWNKQGSSSKSRNPRAATSVAPNHYNVSYSQIEEKQANYTMPKEQGANFVAKAVKEKLVDIRNKKEMPGPGTYDMGKFDDSKISRGTRHLQLRGLTRSAVSGYL